MNQVISLEAPLIIKKNIETQSLTNQTLNYKIKKKKNNHTRRFKIKKILIKITRIKTKIKNKLKGKYNSLFEGEIKKKNNFKKKK